MRAAFFHQFSTATIHNLQDALEKQVNTSEVSDPVRAVVPVSFVSPIPDWKVRKWLWTSRTPSCCSRRCTFSSNQHNPLLITRRRTKIDSSRPSIRNTWLENPRICIATGSFRRFCKLICWYVARGVVLKRFCLVDRIFFYLSRLLTGQRLFYTTFNIGVETFSGILLSQNGGSNK